MIPFKAIAHNQEYSFNVPTSWDEITLKQWLQLHNEWNHKDIIKLIAILTGLDRDTIFNTIDIDIDEKIYPHLKFIFNKIEPSKLPVPEYITIDGKTLTVPKDVTIKCLGQKLSLQNYTALAAGQDKKQRDCYAYAIAIYMFQEITSKTFDEDEAIKLIPIIENCKFIEAYPVGTFFFNSYMKYLKESAKNYQVSTHRTKFSQAWTKLIRMVGSVRWTLLPKAIFLTTKKYFSCRMHMFSKNSNTTKQLMKSKNG